MSDLDLEICLKALV